MSEQLKKYRKEFSDRSTTQTRHRTSCGQLPLNTTKTSHILRENSLYPSTDNHGLKMKPSQLPVTKELLCLPVLRGVPTQPKNEKLKVITKKKSMEIPWSLTEPVLQWESRTRLLPCKAVLCLGVPSQLSHFTSFDSPQLPWPQSPSHTVLPCCEERACQFSVQWEQPEICWCQTPTAYPKSCEDSPSSLSCSTTKDKAS